MLPVNYVKQQINKMKTLLIALLLSASFFAFPQNDVKVKKGDTAIDFTLKAIDGSKVKLSEVNIGNPVVLLVLRGWPEYQCPVCSRQVGQFLGESENFQKMNTRLIMVYPGPSEVLKEKAKEFSMDFEFPDNFYFVLDPDYSMVNKYGLRWNAPKETAYPSTFVMDKKGKIVYSKVSSTHGGRADVSEALGVLKNL